jgi:UDP-N-acetylmuramate dehydrogenase
MKINHSVLLSKHTSFRTGGPARFFAEAESVADIQEIIAQATKENLPYMIFGEGSNVLISDTGFAGYVVVPKILGIDFSDFDAVETEVLVIAGAGVHWDDLVSETVSKNLSGLENLSWIPGSVGAAPVQNIGAYGAEIADCLEWVEVLDTKTGEIKKLTLDECQFGYRASIFKKTGGKHFIITRVAFRLKKGGVPNISYKDVAHFFETEIQKGKTPTVSDVRSAIIKIRSEKLPDIKKYGTAGSFFKNPIISAEKYAELLEKFPGMPSYLVGGDKKIPLAWILDKVCGLNGYREGNVGLYETQPLALVNFGGASSTEIKNFAEKISNIVKEKIQIEIEWEVNKI